MKDIDRDRGKILERKAKKNRLTNVTKIHLTMACTASKEEEDSQTTIQTNRKT